jgi:hypothetical protein
VLVGVGLLGGCSKPGRDLQPGRYRATLEVPIGEVPFELDVTRRAGGFDVEIVADELRLRMTDVSVTPGRVTAVLPGGTASLALTVSGNELRGTCLLQPQSGARRTLPLHARRGGVWRYFEQPQTDNADVSGRWAIAFTDDGGTTTRGVAELRQSFEEVTGEIRLPDSSAGALHGEVHGESLRLGRFDGTAVLLYHAHVNARGELEGESWTTGSGHARLHAVRNLDAVVEPATPP